MDRALAFAGIFESACMVDKLAQNGVLSSLQLQDISRSILNTQPESVLEIFGDLSLVQTGNRHICQQLGQGEQQGNVIKYVMSLLHVEGKIRNDSPRLQEIAKQLEKVQAQADYFSAFEHPSVIAGLANCYKQCISTLNFKIQVLGQGEHLRNEETAAKIRTCLLFGVRCAILWHQLGGRRWHLLVKRRQMVEQAQHLLKQHPNP